MRDKNQQNFEEILGNWFLNSAHVFDIWNQTHAFNVDWKFMVVSEIIIEI